MAKKPTTKPKPPSVPKQFVAKFNERRRALLAGLKLLTDMEKAGALRLPYPTLAETVKQMTDAL